MLGLLKSGNNFCDQPLRPWVAILTCGCLTVLGWTLYIHEMEPEAFAENLQNTVQNNGAILAKFQAQPSMAGAQNFAQPHHVGQAAGNGNTLGRVENAFTRLFCIARHWQADSHSEFG